MRRPTILLLAIMLAGCALPGNPGAAKPGSLQAVAGQPVEPLGGLPFTPLRAENARYAGGAGVPAAAGVTTGSTAAAAAPAPAAAVPMPAASAAVSGPASYGPPAPPDGLTSGNMNGGYYGFGPSFGGGAPTALVSITQAETAGSKGPYQSLLKDVVQPVIKDWASDAALISSAGQTGPDGLLVPPSPTPAPASSANGACSPSYYGPMADSSWRLNYYSASRNEMLNFVVTPDKTTIVRTRWAPLDLASIPVSVDDDAAIRALTNAIKTQGFKSEEEKTGLDYFLGVPYTKPCYGPAPMPVPAAGGTPYDNHQEVVYDVPADARWSANLEVMLGKPVWQLNFYAQSNKPTSDQDNYYFNNSANGIVDAQTGAVIRFGRPSKQFFTRPVPGPSITPQPFTPPPPQKTPVPSPSVTGSPAPSPSVVPSASPSPAASPVPSSSPSAT